MDFRTFIKSKSLIVMDGAMGTQMISKGLQPGGAVNIINPKAIARIHKDYIEAGCEVIIANTFTTNRIYAETHNINVNIVEANRAGVRIAKSVCNQGCYVLGDLGSTGQLLEPYGTYSEEQFYSTFKEQAEILAETGVDGFIIETQSDLKEAICALRACRSIADLPIIISFALSINSKGFVTMMGNFVKDCIEQTVAHGADIIGANCGELDPFEMAEVVSKIKSITNLPIIVQPNAGKPKLVDGKTKYDMPPEVFADGIKKCIEAGAKLVGGCCGTTPEHISKVRHIICEAKTHQSG